MPKIVFLLPISRRMSPRSLQMCTGCLVPAMSTRCFRFARFLIPKSLFSFFSFSIIQYGARPNRGGSIQQQTSRTIRQTRNQKTQRNRNRQPAASLTPMNSKQQELRHNLSDWISPWLYYLLQTILTEKQSSNSQQQTDQ